MDRLRTTVDLLDAVREHLKNAGFPDSDYRVAKELGVTQQTVSGWRVRRCSMSDETGLAVAKLLGIHQEYVMACLQLERAKTQPLKTFWEDMAKRSGAAIFTVFTVSALLLPWWVR